MWNKLTNLVKHRTGVDGDRTENERQERAATPDLSNASATGNGSEFEVDLAARDELVSLLATQLREAEVGAEKYRKEVERRQHAMRGLRQKVGELEKICRGLEDELERSREESFDRSVMDEASGGALVALHGSIGQLQGELEKVRQERDALNSKVETLSNGQVPQQEVERELRNVVESKLATIQDLEDKLASMSQTNLENQEKLVKLQADVDEKENAIDEECKKYRLAEAQWSEEKVDLEHERDQVIEDFNLEREHAEQLVQSLQEQVTKLEEVDQERHYATDNVARLEELLRVRDVENAEAQARIIEREQEAEQLRAQMNKMKREHSRFAGEQGRTLDDTLQREEASRRQMEAMVKQKAEDEIAIGSMKERLDILADETERLKRQVHELQQESADKDIKLLQLTKARAQDKEDKEGLNIALDSKQQELELLKRKLGLKGTAGSTPAPNRVGVPDSTPRRPSLTFATPSAPRSRPSSVAGTAKATPNTDLAKTRLGASANGNSARNSVATPNTVKPARPGSAMKRTPVGPSSLSASTSSLSRSTSSRRSVLPISAHRRSSSVLSAASTILSEDGDKENAPPAKAARKSMVPA